MAFFVKKQLAMAFLLISLGVLALSCPLFVSAYTNFLVDTFESYNYGNLSGQGNWYSGTTASVVSDIVHTGTHSVYVAGGGIGVLYDDETSSTNGIVSFYFYPKENGDFAFRTDSIENGQVVAWQFYLKISTCNDQFCEFYYWNSGNWQYYGVVSIEEWNNVQTRWYIDGSEFKWSFNLNGGGWHEDMLTPYGQSHQFINRIRFETSNGLFYFDDIGGEVVITCGIGNCDLCENWTTCQTAGCNWGCAPDWSGLGCFCEEPISQPEECGGFFKCQYCETEEACTNADPTCEWATRGQITKCFTKRPVVPEAQEPWQTCEFDDCDPDPPLGTIERWVCLLKNMFQGIYCPSQETLTDLQNTIETFEEKFPFNYIVAIKEFLNDIKTSLATPKNITISMFGASGNVNFDFLDMPITIGGVQETMGNIFTDITSIFIYIAFFFWLLAFIRRFF